MTLFGSREVAVPRAEAVRGDAHPTGRSSGRAVAPSADVRRVLLRLQGADDILIGITDGREEGVRLARQVIRLVDEAEAQGSWPALEDRFIRPGAIVSVDVQRLD